MFDLLVLFLCLLLVLWFFLVGITFGWFVWICVVVFDLFVFVCLVYCLTVFEFGVDLVGCCFCLICLFYVFCCVLVLRIAEFSYDID